MHKALLRFASSLLIAGLFACGGGGDVSENPAVISGSTDLKQLEITDVVEGTGDTAAVGHVVSIAYEAWLYDVNEPELKGQMFDSASENAPFSFRLGAGDVISGVDQGVIGMKVGGQRTLIIPSGLAYGREGAGPIPPNAALVFEVELVDVD